MRPDLPAAPPGAGAEVTVSETINQPTDSVANGVAAGKACDQSTEYKVTRRYSDNLSYVGPEYVDYNGTANNATATFTSTYSRTVTFGASGEISVDANVILAGVKASLGVNVSYSLTAGTGNNFAITVPPKMYGHGRYGVFRVVTDGSYIITRSNCIQGRYAVRAYSPRKVGWNAYTSATG